ncbi:TonB-dependent receptor domain-containing protein [uncultured Hydrogenophaga sp.]|uniref:TonB-dependent receptor domain-containing protein n=1 Tax=uncultured Hydrogenophaga sp. TaxID=199683 RepID=UPI00265D93BB|nr:TonB-dependent receptor [uncultured Hydrogenophaga sp.]
MKSLPLRARRAALPLAVLAACPCLPALAQAPVAEPFELRPSVVTATRVETRADALLSDVTVIDGQELRDAPGRTLSEVLARRAGLQMSSNGGLGKTASLFFRGTEARHVLLLVDGVRFGSSTTATPTLDNLPLSSIERVEILKGPASALYGSDAVGGVIQVFTRRGREGFEPNASVTLGSHGHRAATAGFSGGTGTVDYALSLGTVRERGFSATNPAVSFNGHNPDDDAFEQDSISASLGWTLAPGWRTGLTWLQAEGLNEYDNGAAAFNVRSETFSRALGWSLERQWTPKARTQLKVARSDDRSTNFNTATTTSAFNTAQTQITLQHDWATPIGTALLGVESIKEAVSGTQAYAVRSRTTEAAFAGLQGEAGGHIWQANLRRDSNSQFGGATTGFASYGYQLTPNWRPHLAYGTSFKTPSFNTLYFVSPTFTGNPSTQPERGKSREVGLTWSQGAHEVKLTRFDNRIRGFITLQPVVTNVPRARIEGWSLGWLATAGAWRWNAQLELLDARNELNQRKLVRRADEQLTLGVDHSAGAWNWGSSLLAQGRRFDNAANTVALAGFATVDLYARYRIDPQWSVSLRLNNLADKVYETARGYNQPGRAAYVTLDWSPVR